MPEKMESTDVKRWNRTTFSSHAFLIKKTKLEKFLAACVFGLRKAKGKVKVHDVDSQLTSRQIMQALGRKLASNNSFRRQRSIFYRNIYWLL